MAQFSLASMIFCAGIFAGGGLTSLLRAVFFGGMQAEDSTTTKAKTKTKTKTK
jgi:hypothetical protein